MDLLAGQHFFAFFETLKPGAPAKKKQEPQE
jgi:hypothetical protein